MGIIIATLIVVVAIASAFAQDFAIFSWDYWLEGGNALRSEVVRNLGLLAAAVIGLVVGSWRAVLGYMQAQASQRQAEAASEQARIAQQGQFTERFSRAAEHLGSGQLPVRLGGIYALWRLAQDSPERDVVPVIDILCAFIRDPPPIEPPPSTGEADAAQPRQEPSKAATNFRPDVQAVLKLLGDGTASYRQFLPADYRLDLTGAYLVHAKVWEAGLMYADLMNADLTDADLSFADLSDAGLMHANLTQAILVEAKLTNVGLPNANLTGASLWGADLTLGSLPNANLTRADLTRANLTDANLTEADLTEADLTRANLTNANLTDANLTEANLTGADNLTQEQLDSACIRKHGVPPTLPEGLKPPQKVCPPRTR